jgi:HEAT repeat protein
MMNSGVRSVAAAALERIESRSGVDQTKGDEIDRLIARLTRSNTPFEAAEALGTIGGDRAVQAMIAALASVSERVRIAVIDALGVANDARAVDPLIDALDDQEPDVRAAAARALGSLGDPRAIEPLERVSQADPYKIDDSYEDPSTRSYVMDMKRPVRDAAKEAVERIESR